ncbi:hypothetical protein [Arthrobacter rhizosphaerae]|nr:hypothetical protein [Arthrobacter rhizosphaerae]
MAGLPTFRHPPWSDLGGVSLDLDTDTHERLDKIWPGPGEAPQAYAW